MENSLVKIVEESSLEKPKAQYILEKFEGFFKQAQEWEVKARTIVVTDAFQKEEMKKARDARLVMKGIRTGAENVRKELKEQSLREGKAIDGVANVIKALVVPIEEYLETQEKFAERIEEERLGKLAENRIVELGKYLVPEEVAFYDLREMTSILRFDQVFRLQDFSNHQR